MVVSESTYGRDEPGPECSYLKARAGTIGTRLHDPDPRRKPLKSYVFRVVIEDDVTEGGEKAYHAFCPVLKGCHTWGRTYEEALANIREAIELYVDDLRESGEPVPVNAEQGAVEWPTPAVAVNL